MTDTVKVDPSEFGFALGGILQEYMDDVRKAQAEDIEAAGQVALKAVKATSPRRTGGYASGWKMDMRNVGTDLPDAIIYNAKKPGLAHLLEKGHALRGGGRAPAYPHIAPAAELGMAELKRRMHG